MIHKTFMFGQTFHVDSINLLYIMWLPHQNRPAGSKQGKTKRVWQIGYCQARFCFSADDSLRTLFRNNFSEKSVPDQNCLLF